MTEWHQAHTEGEAAQALPVLAGCWDLRLGYHPSLAYHLPMLGTLPLFPDTAQQNALIGLDLPITFTSHGHHVVRDAAYLAAAIPSGSLHETVDEYPLAPVFVRDLCGRVIHTGLNPLPASPSIPIFPSGCQHLPASHVAAGLVENALFLTYRRIECAAPHPNAAGLAGQPELTLRALVARPQQYPYKLRPDTFYADGWRLPQTVRVFAQPVSPHSGSGGRAKFSHSAGTSALKVRITKLSTMPIMARHGLPNFSNTAARSFLHWKPTTASTM